MTIDDKNAEAKAKEARRIQRGFARPFAVSAVKFKPQMVKNNRALAMCYIDARLIQDRLDEVVGVAGWQDEYAILEDGSVICRLRVLVWDEWVTKTDVGSQPEQPERGDQMKAAFSDALKRAAVKFGIGRYLYRIPSTWVDYDPQTKRITQPPRLPAFAIPSATAPEHEAEPTPPPEGRDPTVGSRAPEATVQAALRPAADVLAQKILAAVNRDGLTRAYREYETAIKDEVINAEEKAALDGLFAKAGEKFPRPKTAPKK